MMVYGTCLIHHFALRNGPPSPYFRDIQTFYERGGEGLKALRIKDLKFTRREPFPCFT